MKDNPPKSSEQLFDLDRKSDEPPSVLENPENQPHVVCLAGSGRCLGQLKEIFRGFSRFPENIAWVLLSNWGLHTYSSSHHSAVALPLKSTPGNWKSIVSIREGSCKPLVGGKAYVIHPESTLLLTPEKNLVGLKGKPQNRLWLEDCAKALAAGSPHPLRVVLLASSEFGFRPPVLEWFHGMGAKFFTPLFTPFERPGGQPSQEHIGGLTKHLVDGPIPYKSAALNELVAAITESIGEED